MISSKPLMGEALLSLDKNGRRGTSEPIQWEITVDSVPYCYRCVQPMLQTAEPLDGSAISERSRMDMRTVWDGDEGTLIIEPSGKGRGLAQKEERENLARLRVGGSVNGLRLRPAFFRAALKEHFGKKDRAKDLTPFGDDISHHLAPLIHRVDGTV